MNRLSFLLLFFLGSFFFNYGQALLSNKKVNILFVGNSLTYSNNLPKLVKDIAKKKGILIKTKMIAYPNYALIDHLDDKEVKAALETNKYDFLIVQQGPSSQSEGRKLLFESVEKLSEICHKNECQLAVFMVWPSKQYYRTFNKVIKNHREVAEKYNALLCPVGEVWKAHFEASNNFDYYSSDGFHPSKKGSQVAAQIIVDSLFEKL
jgi:hypothetical protein